MTHVRLQDYLAAQFVIDSSLDARDLLHRAPTLRRIYPFVCAMSPDATSLLEHALNNYEQADVDHATFLARIVAQPVTATDETISRTCDRVVSLLESLCSDWTQVRELPLDPEEERRALWSLAIGTAPDGWRRAPQLRRLLGTVHRARTGRAKPAYVKRLASSPSGVLRDFKESLSVEGRFDHRVVENDDRLTFVAEVLEPAM
jgi:hypothetical protein